jgi:hypothetical protein
MTRGVWKTFAKLQTDHANTSRKTSKLEGMKCSGSALANLNSSISFPQFVIYRYLEASASFLICFGLYTVESKNVVENYTITPNK